MGDRVGGADDARASFGTGDVEPQAIIYEALFVALEEWPDDPRSATAHMARAVTSPDAAPASLLDAAFATALERHGADAKVIVLPYARYQLPANMVRMDATPVRYPEEALAH